MDSSVQKLIRQRTREIIEDIAKQGLQPDQMTPEMLRENDSAAYALRKVKFQPPTIPEGSYFEGYLPNDEVKGGARHRRLRSPEPELEYEHVPKAAPKKRRAPSEHSVMVREYMKKHPGVKLGEASKAVAAMRRGA
jgi:hypothetical protein